MEKQETNDIRIIVRERYGKIAEQSKPQSSPASCCSPSASSSGCCDKSTLVIEDESGLRKLYEAEDVTELPAEVTDLSLGCGDPVTLAQLELGQTVLDLGSGGGIDCFLAAKRVGPTGRVIGVDMTASMIERARANKAKLRANNVEFRLGEIEHLPVADETVDVIISNCVINLSPDKLQVFRETFRVLRPGGKLSVSDIVTNGPLADEIKSSLSAWAGCVAGALEVDDYVAAIEAAGFTDIQITPVYLEKEMVEQAVEQLDNSIDLTNVPAEQLHQAVFSAKITARKPAA